MARRRISDAQITVRKRYEEKFSAIPPLSEDARKLLSPAGFLYTFLEIRMLYQTYEDAYEMLESQVERITGERMYSEYSSFRIQYLRWKTKNAHHGER